MLIIFIFDQRSDGNGFPYYFHYYDDGKGYKYIIYYNMLIVNHLYINRIIQRHTHQLNRN